MQTPLPPFPLRERVGGGDYFEGIGETSRRDFLALLPPSFDWSGARVLDFGCGVGRTLRYFTEEASRAAEFSGCDIDEESIVWVQDHLCPPFRAFRNEEVPPLPFADASLDLVYCMSVFTHLADTWSAWLLELHRILQPGGLLLATTMGPGTVGDLGRAWDEDRIGMLVTIPNETFVGVRSGPVVFHSEWWIREHWGRAFEVLETWSDGFCLGGPQPVPTGQGCVALKKREVALTMADLEGPSDDPRELAALEENLSLLHDREAAWRARAQVAESELAAISATRSWRLARMLAAAGRPFARRPQT